LYFKLGKIQGNFPLIFGPLEIIYRLITISVLHTLWISTYDNDPMPATNMPKPMSDGLDHAKASSRRPRLIA
jgi:hypothetical protein